MSQDLLTELSRLGIKLRLADGGLTARVARGYVARTTRLRPLRFAS